MADDKQVDFVDGVTAVTEQFLDRVQEINAPLAWNFNLTASGTSLVLPAGTLENRASIVIKGKMRFTESPLSISFTPLAAGSYGIWANTTENDASSAFTLQAVLGTSAPSGVTYTRKVATVDWNGSNLSNLVYLGPYLKHGSQHISGGSDPLPNNSVSGAVLIDKSVDSGKINDRAIIPDKVEIFPFLHFAGSESSSFSNSPVLIKTAGAVQRGLSFLTAPNSNGNYPALTIPRSGIYTVCFALNFDGPLNGTYVQAYITVNPKDNYYNSSPAGFAAAVTVSITDYFTVGKTISFYYTSDSTVNPGANHDITISWIGP